MAILPLPYHVVLATQWLAGGIVCLALLGRGRAVHKALGWGLLSVPVWGTLLGIANSIPVLADPGSVAPTLSRTHLSRVVARKLLDDLGTLLVGYLVWSWDLGAPWRRTPRSIADHLASVGWPTGRRSEAGSALAGYLAFPLLAIATLGLMQATSAIEALHNGDESGVWVRMTPYHVLMLSLAAGVGEEVFYRGFLQTAMARRLPVLAAVAAQALLFGFAHAGYGTWLHVLGPVAFGVMAGIVAWRWGLWAAIVLHVLIDVYAFGPFANTGWPWMGSLLVAALAVNFAAFLAWLAIRLARRRPGAPT